MCDYQIGDELEAKYAVDEEWYPAKVMDFDEEFREYTVQFTASKEEQICDRSFLRPLPDVVDRLVHAEIKRQKEEQQQEKRARGATRSALQKRMEAKEKELQEKKKQQVDEDEFGDLAAAAGVKKSPRPPPPSVKALTVADALESSDEEQNVPKKKEEPPKKAGSTNPLAAAAAAAVAAKKAVVNPIAAAAAALVAKKQQEPKAAAAAAEPKKPEPVAQAKLRASKRDSRRSSKRGSVKGKKVALFSSDEEKDATGLVQAADDPFATGDDPFADKPLFSDAEGNDVESDDDTDEVDDEAVAAEFLAKKKAESEAKKREEEEQKLLREQMYSKKGAEEDVDWLSGEECEAKWAEDNNWYKALVIGAEPDGTYTVEFTEYNQLQECTPPADMRRVGAGDAARTEQAVPGDSDEESDRKVTSSSDDPSPLPSPKGPPAPPKVSVPALNLTPSPAKKPAAKKDALPDKLTLSKVEGSSEEDDEELRDEPKAPVAAPKSPVPAAGKATAAKNVAKLPPPPKKALPPVVPGWSTFNTVFGSAYDGWDFASTSVVDGRMRLVQHDAPRPRTWPSCRRPLKSRCHPSCRRWTLQRKRCRKRRRRKRQRRTRKRQRKRSKSAKRKKKRRRRPLLRKRRRSERKKKKKKKRSGGGRRRKRPRPRRRFPQRPIATLQKWRPFWSRRTKRTRSRARRWTSCRDCLRTTSFSIFCPTTER